MVMIVGLGLLLASEGAVQGEDNAADSSKPRVEYRISKVQGLLSFLEALSGGSQSPSLLGDLFWGSSFDTPATRNTLEEFESACIRLVADISHQGYPPSRHAGRDLGSLFLIRSGFSTDLDDFSERTLGLLPVPAHEALFRSLRAMEPIYEELVWKPTVSLLEERRKEFRQAGLDWNLDQMFRDAARFYGAVWPESQPFVVGLYPLPGRGGATSAESLGVFESVGVLVEAEDIAGRFGVIFHEMCHSLYGAQPSELQFRLEGYYTDSESPYSMLAYGSINEGLATALGNGWAFEQATGQIDEGEWYANDVIDRYGKALYPLVKTYLEEGRTMDEEFVEQSIELFAATFPDSIYRYEVQLNSMLLLSDGNLMRSEHLRRELGQRIRISSVASSAPINHPRTLEMVEGVQDAVLAVISEQGTEQLEDLAELCLPVADALPELVEAESSYLFSTLDPEGRAFVIIQVAGAEEVGSAFEAMKRLGKIAPDTPFHFAPGGNWDQVGRSRDRAGNE